MAHGLFRWNLNYHGSCCSALKPSAPYGSDTFRCTRRQHQHRYLKATLTDETPAPASKNRAGTSIGIGPGGSRRKAPSSSQPRRTGPKTLVSPEGPTQVPGVRPEGPSDCLPRRTVWTDARPSVLDPSANLRNAPGGEAERFVLCILMKDQPHVPGT